MKQVTVTLELEDEELAWLERWRVFHPGTHAPLTLEQKIAACVFGKWTAEDFKAQHAENADLWEAALEIPAAAPTPRETFRQARRLQRIERGNRSAVEDGLDIDLPF